MKVDVLNIEGKSTGRSVDLPDAIFGIEPNEHAVYLAVKLYNNNQRQGTSKTKERGEVKGSTRKIKKQKGTGTARAGDIKNPLFKGGGRIFGPKPRDYKMKVNKKVKRIAKLSALSSKVASGELAIIEDFTFEAPEVKGFKSILDNLEIGNKKALFVTADYDSNVYLSCRNLSKASVMNAKDLNTYSILNANKVVLSESAVTKMTELLA